MRYTITSLGFQKEIYAMFLLRGQGWGTDSVFCVQFAVLCFSLYCFVCLITPLCNGSGTIQSSSFRRTHTPGHQSGRSHNVGCKTSSLATFRKTIKELPIQTVSTAAVVPRPSLVKLFCQCVLSELHFRCSAELNSVLHDGTLGSHARLAGYLWL